MQNKEKMERLAALSLLVLGIMLVFAVFDANRVNQRLSELQQTVDYGQQLEKLLFPNGGYPATAETAETAESAEKEMSEPVIDFTVTGDGIVPSEESYGKFHCDLQKQRQRNPVGCQNNRGWNNAYCCCRSYGRMRAETKSCNRKNACQRNDY